MLACVDDYRAAARRRLSRIAFDYLDGGAEDGGMLERNRDAYARWLFRPRVMADVSRCTTATSVWGRGMAAPMIVGPTGLNGLFWHRADELLACAAAQAGLPFVLSTASTSLLEDVRAAAPQADLWLQLYVQQDRGIAQDMMRRARAAGYSTLMLTVDTPVHGNRDHDIRNGFKLPLRISGRLLADCLSHPRWTWQMVRYGSPELKNLAKSAGENPDLNRHAALLSRQMDMSLTWSDMEWLRRHWPGRVMVKGILSVEDAMLARDAGVDGIVLSNHGGRQLASTYAPLELLPAVCAAVGGQVKVFVDGGVRRGSDAVKALALGAAGVLLGRAPLYGVAAQGQSGVADVLRILQREMQTTMQLLGCVDVKDLDASRVAPGNDMHGPLRSRPGPW